MQDLITFVGFGIIGIFIALILFAVLGEVLHRTGGGPKAKCNGHAWAWTYSELLGKDVLRCGQCLKSFEEVLRDD